MKNTTILILALICCLRSSAQKNRIETGILGYKFINTIEQQNNLFNQLRINYSRLIKDKIYLYAQYSKAPLLGRLLVQEQYLMSEVSLGKIENRKSFNYFDAGASYEIYKYRNHILSAFGGISIAYGENSYLTHVVWTDPEPGEPYGHPIEASYQSEKEVYWGGIFGLRYDYHLWNNMINLGVDFSTRLYSGKKNAHLENTYPNTQVPDPNIPGGRHNFPFQINYGIHIGYNF